VEPSAPPATAVLLAAGAGTRLGHGPKALLRSAGVPLVSRLAGELRAAGCAGVVVVLGAEAARVRREAPLPGCEVVVNAAWAAGMAGSFRAGIAAVPAGHAVLVALVDQPGVDRRTAARLLAAHTPGRVAAAAYRQGGRLRRRHPVLFSAGPAREAAALASGDAGARAWLGAHPELVDLIDCSDLGDGRDIDTAADLVLLGPEPDPGSGAGSQAGPAGGRPPRTPPPGGRPCSSGA
jgi:nicotine blue oxidoreductase